MELVNQTFGIYIVVEKLNKKAKDGHSLYKVKCNICGREFMKTANKFSAPNSIVNNCAHNNKSWKTNDKRLQNIYYKMKTRCYNPNNKDYKYYGKKDIKICDEWLDDQNKFIDWAYNNGYNPNLTIDRIDPSKNYCPENCRWVSLKDNSKYKSTTNLIEVNEEIHSGREWSKICNFSQNTINKYLREYGLEKTIKLIEARIENPNLKCRSKKTWMDIYNIE